MTTKTMAIADQFTMAHKEIPGNPSTAKSSELKLNDRSNGQPLRLLTEEDWRLWIHGIRANTSKDKVRIAQYLAMMPAQEENEELRQWRINSWKNRNAMTGYAFPGDPLEREKRNAVAELSPLGKRLLGWKIGSL